MVKLMCGDKLVGETRVSEFAHKYPEGSWFTAPDGIVFRVDRYSMNRADLSSCTALNAVNCRPKRFLCEQPMVVEVRLWYFNPDPHPFEEVFTDRYLFAR